MQKLKNLLLLFFTMIKIGLFTFGGGYAMISVFDSEFVGKHKWLSSDEFSDLVVIAESTPGPIAINCATYIGYKRCGILGSVIATLGICIPSFAIIFIISLFFEQFLAIKWVYAAFRGIQVAVVFLVLNAGIKMFKKIKKSALNITLFTLSLTVMIAFRLLSITFSSIYYVLIGALAGVTVYTVSFLREKCVKVREENKK